MADFDKEKLKIAQEASLTILTEFDRICRSNNIRYFLDAGTLIGALRHEGFIPWDDDIDVAMLRADFETFKEIAGNELKEDFKLILPDEYRGGKAFYDFTPRIIYLKSSRQTDSREMDYYEGKLNHLWVDIFIIDNISDNPLMDKILRLRLKALYGFAMSKRFSLDYSKYTGLNGLIVRFLSLMGRFMDLNKIFKKEEKLAAKYNNRPTKHRFYSNYQPDYIHDTLSREWNEGEREGDFEGRKFLIPMGAENVLREIYGDYMTLPPIEDRVPSHSLDIAVWD